ASCREFAQIAQARDGARAVPADQLAVDEAHARARAQRLRFAQMRIAERIRLAAEQQLLQARKPWLVAAQRGVARSTGGTAGDTRQRVPADAREHARDGGV